MADLQRVVRKIRYTDGSSGRFSFPRDNDDDNLITRFQPASESNSLILELEDRLLAIPLHNIRSIEVSPKPPKLAPQVLRGAKRED